MFLDYGLYLIALLLFIMLLLCLSCYSCVFDLISLMKRYVSVSQNVIPSETRAGTALLSIQNETQESMTISMVGKYV